MSEIKILSKQNGVGIVLSNGTVFLGDPDADFVAEAGALTTQVRIKRDIDTFYIVKDVAYTDIKDSTGTQIGTSRDNCVSVLNSDYFNRTSKIQELDNVDFQNTITAGQVLKFVDIGGGILRISNEAESGGGAANMSQTFSAPSGTTGGEFQAGARLVVDAYGTNPAATAGTLSFFGTTAAAAVGAQSPAAAATGMLTVVTDAGDSDELLVEGVVKMSTATTNLLLPTNSKPGTPVYMSTTAGAVTTTAPSGTGEFVRVVGHVVDATNRTIYFKPDNTWLEL